jgi:hypothetical protein
MPTRITASVKPKKKKSLLVIITLIVVGILFAVGIGKKMPASSGPAQANYHPTFVCENAWEHDVNYADFTGDHFDVVAREGCWGGHITLPMAWNSRWHFQVLGNDPKTWIAFCFPDPYPPAGPYGRNAVIEFPHHPMKFRLQGKGTFRFYRR